MKNNLKKIWENLPELLKNFIRITVNLIRHLFYGWNGIHLTFGEEKIIIGFKNNTEFSQIKKCYHKEYAFWTKYLKHLNKSKVVFDIGANIGLYSLMAGKFRKDIKIFSFEPEPISYDRLIKNIQRNKIDNITPFQLAIGDIKKTAKLKITGNKAGCTQHHISKKNKGINIEMNSIDNLIKSEKITIPDLIKIDVEGYEFNVLLGMKQILKNYKPIIFIEIHPKKILDYGKTKEDIDNLLNKYGYKKTIIHSSHKDHKYSPHRQIHIIYYK